MSVRPSRTSRFLTRLFHWEYWNMHVVYIPDYVYYVWLCIRSGWKYFFNAADPLIENGGFLMESKKKIYDSLPSGSYPRTLFFKENFPAEEVVQKIREAGFQFPLIAKPDIGMRGLAAQKLESESDILHFIPAYSIDFLIQEFVPWKNEVGIFYCRYPDQRKGFVTGIVGKEFMTITGNGKNSLAQLVLANPRYALQWEALEKEYGTTWNEVIPAGERIELLPYGNHARGALFLDHSDQIDDRLTQFMDAYCQLVPEFYFGRLDIRFNDWEELRQGKNFSVIELNGAGSEPTHMYDPKHSLFFAWKELIRHHRILFRIARQNHQRGYPYMTFAEGQAMFRASRVYTKKLQGVHARLVGIEKG